MKVAVASDLHLEFQNDGGTRLVESLPAADVLVCAGDLTNAQGLDAGLRLLCGRYEHVVHVCGNHEYYGSSVFRVREQLRALSIPGLHHLDNSSCVIGGQRFVGSTLWFPEWPGVHSRERFLRDFQAIEDASHVLYLEHKVAAAYLEAAVRHDDVVVTHHLPSFRCVSRRFRGSPLNCFFVGPVDNLIAEKAPRYWIHGHTHDKVDLILGTTRVLCNPKGYPSETQSVFSAVILDL